MVRVLKYGGSSVADTNKILDIAKYLKTRVVNEEKLVVVLSAMGKETDELLTLAKLLSQVPCSEEIDQLLSIGEVKSVSLMTIALNELGVKAKSLVGTKTGIITYGDYQNSKIKEIDVNQYIEALIENDVVVVAGFQGVNEENNVTTLGRGGSDTTAIALACALGVDCEIYTDVNGIYSTDPRLSSFAKRLDYISYEEMCELSSLGANVMHNRSIRLASQFDTEIYVGKSLNTEEGTLILNKKPFEENKVTGIAVEKNVTHFSITYDNNKENKENIFRLLTENNKNFDMLSQGSCNDIAFINFAITDVGTLGEIYLVELIKKLSGVINVSVNSYSKISLVGTGIRENNDIMNKIISVFQKSNTDFYELSMSDISLSILIDKNDIDIVVNSLMIEFEI